MSSMSSTRSKVPQVPPLSVPDFRGWEMLHQGQSQRLKPHSVAVGNKNNNKNKKISSNNNDSSNSNSNKSKSNKSKSNSNSNKNKSNSNKSKSKSNKSKTKSNSNSNKSYHHQHQCQETAAYLSSPPSQVEILGVLTVHIMFLGVSLQNWCTFTRTLDKLRMTSFRITDFKPEVLFERYPPKNIEVYDGILAGSPSFTKNRALTLRPRGSQSGQGWDGMFFGSFWISYGEVSH